jgi:superfamily I DNA/RNA helicase
VLAPTARVAALRERLLGEPQADAPDIDLSAPVVVLPVNSAKGLEFDAVVVVEPAELLSESPHGANDLYVALTRSTQRLAVVHAQPLPAMLHRLADG